MIEMLRGVLHALICPLRSRWFRYRNHEPFWHEDPVAFMLGRHKQGCFRCGRVRGRVLR